MPGTDDRVLVVDGRVVAAAQVRPAAVTGDGVHDIKALIELANADPQPGDGHSRPLSRILIDTSVLSHLAAQGLRPDSVPGPGTMITLRRNANLSTGGTSPDVTDLIHPDDARTARPAMREGNPVIRYFSLDGQNQLDRTPDERRHHLRTAGRPAGGDPGRAGNTPAHRG